MPAPRYLLGADLLPAALVCGYWVYARYCGEFEFAS